MGNPIRVLAGNFNGRSPWDKDINEYSEGITRVDLLIEKQPYHLQKLPVNWREKLLWKTSLLIWEWKKKRLTGNYRDASRINTEAFYQKAIELILNECPAIVILSVGPFAYSSLLIRLREQFPSISYVLDYRDYWEDDFIGLTKAQIEFETAEQQEVIKSIDLILCPNEEMKIYYSKFGKPVHVLPHCIDEEDIANIVTVNRLGVNLKRNTIHLIYGGAFYSGLTEVLKEITDFISILSKQRVVNASFYVSVKGYEEQLNHPAIKREGFIELDDYFKRVVEADYVLLVLPVQRRNAKSSKFYELVALKKPILYFGPEGEVSDFIIKHNLGYHIKRDLFKQQVEEILSNLNTRMVPSSYEITQNTFAYNTTKLINLLANSLCTTRIN